MIDVTARPAGAPFSFVLRPSLLLSDSVDRVGGHSDPCSVDFPHYLSIVVYL